MVRRAEVEDAAAVWELANDPFVRSKAFNHHPIPFDDHLRWFRDRLASPRCRLWVVIENGRLVAQVRYDKIDDRVAEVDIAVAESHRGRGLGPMALDRTWRESCESLGAPVVRGVVLDGNEPSARAFRKSGFDLAGTQTINGRSCLLFERHAAPVERNP